MNKLHEIFIKHPKYKLLSKGKLYEILKDDGITKKNLSDYLDKKEITQIYAKPKIQTNFIITAPLYSFQIDVALLPKYKLTNKGITQFFILVDILSRKAFAYTLKDGKMETILEAYEKFFIDVGEQPNSVAGDDFFNNKEFEAFNHEMLIKVYTDVAKDDHITKMGNKLGIVDRCIRTLKQLIQKNILLNESTNWINSLDEIIDLYNNTPNTGIKNMTPNEVFDDTMYMEGLSESQKIQNEEMNDHIKINIGDKVRVMVGKGIFEKEKAQFSIDTYTVENQQGYRFILKNEQGNLIKKLYRPNEILVIKEVEDRLNNVIEKADKKHKKINKLVRETGDNYEIANEKIKNIDDNKISSRLIVKEKINYKKS